MAYRLLWFTSAVLFLFSISSVVKRVTSSVNMCEKATTKIDKDNLELDAVGPSFSPPTRNTSRTCSCLINTTSSNTFNVEISRNAKGGNCTRMKFAEITLDFITRSRTLQNEELSYFYRSYGGISTMWFNITIHSICGTDYKIQLEESNSWWSIKFSHVVCIEPQTVISPSVTTTSSTAIQPTGVSKNAVSSTYSSKESSSAGSVVENSASASSQIGLIVGLVVGLGGGLLLLGAIILAVFIFRRRRAKRQPLTNANQNAPNETPYELPVARGPVVYEDLRNSTQLCDNQNAATDPLATETNQNYYSVQLQGYDNSTFHQSDAMPNNDQPSSEEVDHFVQEPHLINDTDTTVVENDLYEK